jgi:hypothetical protein
MPQSDNSDFKLGHYRLLHSLPDTTRLQQCDAASRFCPVTVAAMMLPPLMPEQITEQIHAVEPLLPATDVVLCL